MDSPVDALVQALLNKLHVEIGSKGLTQTDLARVLDLPQPSISNLLSGKTKMTMEQFLKISQRLNAKPAELIEAAQYSSSHQTQMPESWEAIIYKSDAHFMAYVSASMPVRVKDLLPYVKAAEKVDSAFKDLCKAGILIDTKEGFVQKDPSKSFYLKKTDRTKEIYREVIQRLWVLRDKNENNAQYRKIRYDWYSFDYFTDEQIRKLDAKIYDAYELSSAFAMENAIRKYEGMGRVKLWGIHVATGTPLQTE